MTPATRKDKPEFTRRQYEFAANIRNPELNPTPPDVEERRMAIYRELFYNNVENFIASGFPVLRSLYDEQRWHAMVRDFLTRHRCQTPYFLEISQEFIDYLQNERKDSKDPPFLQELAHYEWAELALGIHEEEITDQAIDPQGDLLEGIPVLSPLAWLLSYQYDVHRISSEYQPSTPPTQPTVLVVYRDREDEVGFLELNPVSARLLQLLQLEPGHTGREILERIAAELQHPQPEVVIQGGAQILQQLRESDVLLGTRTV